MDDETVDWPTLPPNSSSRRMPRSIGGPSQGPRRARVDGRNRFRLDGVARGLRRPFARTTATLIIASILLLTTLPPLVQGGSPTIIVASMSPLTLHIGQTGQIAYQFKGGYVNATYGYQLFWFFGGTNATAIQSTIVNIAAPSTCASHNVHSSCSKTVFGNESVSYKRPGSYEVSVTSYDGLYQHYSIATDLVTVYDSFTIPCLTLHNTNNAPGRNFSVREGQPCTIEASPNLTSYLGLTYLWNFGDGNTSYGTFANGTTGNCLNDASMNEVTHSYYHSGLYEITLTIYDSWGYAMRRFAFANVTHGIPSVTVSGPSKAFRYSSTTFTAYPSEPNGPDSYSNATREFVWNFGDGTGNFTTTVNSWQTGYSNGTSTISHAFNSTGNFTVKVTIVDGEYGVSSFTTTSASMGIQINSLSIAVLGGWGGVHPLAVGTTWPIVLDPVGYSNATLPPWLNLT
jgi:PKD domain